MAWLSNWGRGEGISHSTILVANNDLDSRTFGTPEQFTGDTVDGHDNPEFHAMWSLSFENPYRSTTHVYPYHLQI